MRNTSETDYDVIKYNHRGGVYECSDGHFKQFSYASVLSCADHAYLRKKCMGHLYYSSTCHRRPPPVLSKSGPSWQVAPRDRERTLCAIMSNQKHTSDSIHSTAHAQQYKAQHSMTILNAVRHETNTAENV